MMIDADAIVVTRDFHVYGPGDVRIDYHDGQTVGIASVPADQNVGRWLEDDLVRFTAWAILGVLVGAIRHRLGVIWRKLRCW